MFRFDPLRGMQNVPPGLSSNPSLMSRGKAEGQVGGPAHVAGFPRVVIDERGKVKKAIEKGKGQGKEIEKGKKGKKGKTGKGQGKEIDKGKKGKKGKGQGKEIDQAEAQMIEEHCRLAYEQQMEAHERHMLAYEQHMEATGWRPLGVDDQQNFANLFDQTFVPPPKGGPRHAPEALPAARTVASASAASSSKPRAK